MNEFKLLPDDPKLTAYALGELEGDERAAVEAALRANPALGAVVDEIRAMAGQLESALAGEPGLPDPVGLPLAGRPGQPAISGPATSAGPTKGIAAADPYSHNGTPKLLRFPQVYYLFGGLAAACFAVVFALRPPRPAPPQAERHYVEIPLGPIEKATAESAAPAEVAAVALPKSEDEKPETQESKSWSGVYNDNGRFGVRMSGLIAQSKQIAGMNAWDKAPLPVFSSSASTVSAAPIENRSLQRQATMMNAKMEASAKTTQKTWSYPQDDKFVINAEPKHAATLAMSSPELATPSPFDVQAPASLSYRANSTLAGTRVRTGLNDVGSSINVVTTQFLSAVARGNSAQRQGNTESYTYRAENEFCTAAQNPLSTFSADVDTASYANVRRMLLAGHRPPADAVRIEELLNYFPYKYSAPAAKDSVPFAATMEMADAPWATNHRLVRIGLKGREVSMAERGAANLVFLLDVSGSMNQPNKLPLVQESMRLLLARLRPDDRVAIVVYAGATGLGLPSTPVKQARDIAAAIDELHASGSTNGAMGIQLAYDIAKANFVEGGINRVVLCTDGDFNVGVTSEGELVRLITEKAKSKVFLTVLGFGMGNYKDATLQQLADAGNGNYGYVDTRREAEKLLVDQVSGTLLAIAKDVKLQVEFNPAKVASYRLIGYEKRMLKTEDFNNDKIDAGEIGAGHTVTALYEVVPVGADNAAKGTAEATLVDELRYVGFGSAPLTMKSVRPEVAGELLTLKVRYKEPSGDTSKRLEFPLADRGAAFAMASADFKFAAAVAGFGMILRDSPHKGAATLADVQGWAEAGIGSDPGGYRAEFVGLVERARALE